MKSIIIWYNTLFEDAWWTYKFISVYRCKCVGVSMKRSVFIQTNDCGSSQKLWERETHTQMAHDPNRFMKGFAFVRESWRGCMRCSPWLAKEMSTDSPIVKTGARKIAGRTWGPVRRFLTRALFSLPCCLRSADVTLRGISHRSAATTLITLDLDGWFSSGGCSKSCVESQMQDANPFESFESFDMSWDFKGFHEMPGMVSAGAKFRSMVWPFSWSPRSLRIFWVFSISFHIFLSFSVLWLSGQRRMSLGCRSCFVSKALRRRRVSPLCPGQPKDHCILPRRAVFFPFRYVQATCLVLH